MNRRDERWTYIQTYRQTGTDGQADMGKERKKNDRGC